jgi:hypothetical protein
VSDKLIAKTVELWKKDPRWETMTDDEKKSAVEIYRLHCGNHCIANLSTASYKNEAEVMKVLGNIINNRIADSVAASVAELATNIQDSCAASTTKGGGSGCDVGKGGHGGDDGSNDHSAPFHGSGMVMISLVDRLLLLQISLLLLQTHRTSTLLCWRRQSSQLLVR